MKKRIARWLAGYRLMGTATPPQESQPPATDFSDCLSLDAARSARRIRRHESVAPIPSDIDLRVEDGHLLPAIDDLLNFVRGLSEDARRVRYPCLANFAREIDLPEEPLIAGYEIENIFHARMLSEPSSEVRQRLNDEVYTKVFRIFGATFNIDFDATESAKDAVVELFKPLLDGRNILDVGCGAGAFLVACSRLIEHGRLCGLDVFASDLDVTERNLTFQRSDVVRFNVAAPFDVAITDNVYEHIADADIDDHLQSIHRALVPGGKVIIMTPHAAFGPWDVTRILDNSYTGWTAPRGTHLNETTYQALSDRLLANGFEDLKAVPPRVRIGDRSAPLLRPLARFCRAERRPTLMRFLQALDKNERFSAFEICVVGTKS